MNTRLLQEGGGLVGASVRAMKEDLKRTATCCFTPGGGDGGMGRQIFNEQKYGFKVYAG